MTNSGSHGLVKFNKIEDSMHTFEKFEQMGNKHGWLSKVKGPAIQLPIMRVPWDCTGIDNQNGQMKATISLSFEIGNPHHELLQDKLNGLDTRAVNHIIANKDKIFAGKKVPSDEMISDQMFYRIIKPSNQPDKYGPTMKAKLEVQANPAFAALGAAPENEEIEAIAITNEGDEPQAKRPRVAGPVEPYIPAIGCYTRDQGEVPINKALAKGCKVRLVVALRHVWCINGRMGLTLYGHRMIVEEFPRTIATFDFDLNDDENEGEEFASSA